MSKSVYHYDLEARIEAQNNESFRRVCDLLMEKNRPDLVEKFTKRKRNIDLGIHSAQMTWGALSAPQRNTIKLMIDGGILLIRNHATKHYYDGVRDGVIVSPKMATRPTVLNLTYRNLLAWDGGAFDPESKVVMTERGMFVFRYGPTHT